MKKTITHLAMLLIIACSTLSWRSIPPVSQKPFAPVNLYVNFKIFLQGVWSTSLTRHKDVTPTWAAVLNANALNQPYSGSPWSYAGTESVASSYFASTGNTSDIVDWVLLELRDSANPATVLSTIAAFIREDGQIVALDGTSKPYFRIAAYTYGHYHAAIKHRNHLAVRTNFMLELIPFTVPGQYDFTAAQYMAYQDPSLISNNYSMVELVTDVFGMRGGNANSNNTVRYTGPSNDYLAISASLSGNQAAILSPVYHNCDVNLDGTVRFFGPNNDILALLSYLNANQAAYRTEHL